MSNCIPCSPCNNNCPDDGEIIETTILDAEECWGCWRCWWCKDNCWINIQSTNDCLTVDTSECWVIKLTAECPKPTYVKAWANVIVKDITPVSDCYIDGWDCWVLGWWEVSATDEKVKACWGDTTPWTLLEKLKGWDNVTIESVNCSWWNAYLKIHANMDCPDYDYPEIVVHNNSKLIETSYWWSEGHEIWIADKETTNYDNMVCLWFQSNKDREITLVSSNAKVAEWIDTSSSEWGWAADWGWDMYTWNSAMATHDWIKILESWYYRVFWQLTVQCHPNDSGHATDNDKYFLNLWRAYLRLMRGWKRILLTTAKHWAYWRQVLFTWGDGIRIDENWTIEFTWWSFAWSWSAPEGWWTVSISGSVKANAWWWVQWNSGFSWPWATFNVDMYVDLYKDDIITLWYRWQSNIAQTWNTWVRFVGNDDITPGTGFDDRVFWWSMLWAHLVAPKLFQAWETTHDKIRWEIQ